MGRVKFGSECYRNINGKRWEWWSEDAEFFRDHGIRYRKAFGGDGAFVHPDDAERAHEALHSWQAAHAYSAALSPDPAVKPSAERVIIEGVDVGSEQEVAADLARKLP